LSEGSYKKLVANTLALSPSGALSPGPLSAVAAAVGGSLGLAGGLLVALGHALFELAYVAALAKLFERTRKAVSKYRAQLLLFVTAFLAYFAALLLRDALQALFGALAGAPPARSFSTAEALAYGVLLTGGNAHFLLWWVTVGYPLVEGASKLGARGLATLFAAHIWLDFLWLGLLAYGAGAAASLGGKAYGLLLLALSAMLLAYAAAFAKEALAGLLRARTPARASSCTAP